MSGPINPSTSRIISNWPAGWKKEKLHITQLFCADKDIEGDDIEGHDIEGASIEGDSIEGFNSGEVDEILNPQILFDTSGTANAGIENPHIYSILRVEVPPSLKDCV